MGKVGEETEKGGQVDRSLNNYLYTMISNNNNKKEESVRNKENSEM